MAQIYADRKEYIRSYAIEWRKNNPEKVSLSRKPKEILAEQARIRRTKNPEKYKAINLKYEQSGKRPKYKNKEVRDRWLERTAEHRKVYEQEYNKKNPHIGRNKRARRRAIITQATIVPFTQEQLKARLSMFGNHCWMCGGPFEEIDHVIPLSKGGLHTLSNLRPSCIKCNRSKGTKIIHKVLN